MSIIYRSVISLSFAMTQKAGQIVILLQVHTHIHMYKQQATSILWSLIMPQNCLEK